MKPHWIVRTLNWLEDKQDTIVMWIVALGAIAVILIVNMEGFK
jgi:hypothetical protein